MEKMVDNADTLAKVLTVIGGLVLFSKIAKMGKIFAKMAGWAKSIAKFFGMAEKAAPKVLQATMKGSGKVVSGAAAKSAVKAGTAVATKVAGKNIAKAGAKTGAKLGLKRIPLLDRSLITSLGTFSGFPYTFNLFNGGGSILSSPFARSLNNLVSVCVTKSLLGFAGITSL